MPACTSFPPNPKNELRLRLRFRLQLLALLFQDRPAAQLDLVAFERQHLHQDLIVFVQLIAGGSIA